MAIRIFSTCCFLSGLLVWRSTWLGCAILATCLLALGLWVPLLRKAKRWQLWVGFALLAGLARAGVDDLGWQAPRGFPNPGRAASMGGTVLESPRQWGKSLVFFFSVTTVDGVETAPALVLVRWGGGEDTVAPGERWEFEGRFLAGQPAQYPGGFSQAFWLWTQRAHGCLQVGKFSEVRYLGPPEGWGPRSMAARLRQIMLARLGPIRDPVARALVAGVVFGDTQALPKDVQDQFRRTGTSHLLAASGMNVALLIGIFAAAARCLGYGPWRVAPWLIPLVVLYAFLAGCAPSIARAAAAAVMGLLAAWLGRSSGAWNSLCLSVWALLLWEPRQVYDLGFGLSVAAVVGLIAGPSLARSAASWKQSALMTVSACLLTLPFMWTTFHELSLTLLPANLILGPLVEGLFPLGLLLTLLPLPPLYWLVEALARLSLWLVGLLALVADPMPLASPGWQGLLLLGLAIALWLICPDRRRWLALPLAFGALALGHWMGARPVVRPGELLVRQIGGDNKPVFWLSSHEQELLVLTEAWQEKRARAMLLDLGCPRTPELKILGPTETFKVRWGGFRWGNVHPLLPKAPYLELRTTGCTYTVRCWRPDEHED